MFGLCFESLLVSSRSVTVLSTFSIFWNKLVHLVFIGFLIVLSAVFMPPFFITHFYCPFLMSLARSLSALLFSEEPVFVILKKILSLFFVFMDYMN